MANPFAGLTPDPGATVTRPRPATPKPVDPDALYHRLIAAASTSRDRAGFLRAHQRELAQLNPVARQVVVRSAGLGIPATDVAKSLSSGSYLNTQIRKAVQDVEGIPAGAIHVAGAVAGDIGSTAQGKPTLGRTLHVAKETGKGVVETVKHPGRDLFQTASLASAALTGGAGAAARIGAITDVARSAEAADLASAVGKLSKADERVYRTLVNPEKHLASIDEHTARRIATPSPQLGRVLDLDPELAAARKEVVQHLGAGKIVPARPGLGAAVREVGASKPAQVAKAAIKTPLPRQRSLVVKDEQGAPLVTVHPVASKNPFANIVERHVADRIRQRQLDKGGPPPEFRSHTVQKLADTAAKYSSAETKIGRELRAQRAVRDALELAPVSQIERFAPSAAARGLTRVTGGRANVATILPKRLRGERLSAAEQKAVDITAAGSNPGKVQAYHENLIARGVGKERDHRLQIALAKASGPHFNRLMTGEHPKLARAVEETRALIQKGEQIKGLSPEGIAHRVGARKADVEAIAAGRLSPLEEIRQLQDEVAGTQPVKGSVADARAKVQAALDENLAQQAPYRVPPAQREAGVKVGTRPQDATFQKLRTQESRLRTRLDELGKHQRIRDIHQGLVDEGFDAIEKGAFYLPSRDRALTRSRVPATRQPGAYGLGPTGTPPWLAHAFTGELQRKGRARSDATRLASESYKQAQRYATIERGYRQLVAAAKETPEQAGGEKFAIPIRTTVAIPDGLKRIINKADVGTLTRADLKELGQPEVEAFAKALFPDKSELADLKGVKWIDSRLLGGLRGTGNPFGGDSGAFLDFVNSPFRAALLYTKPAYALNLLQALGTNVIQQGVFAPLNLRRALSLGKQLGAEDQHAIFSLVGQGLSRSFESSGMGARTINAAGEFWNKIVDHYPRASSWLHEARREGFNTPEKIHSLLNDERFADKLTEITRRANKEAVEFGALSPFEQTALQRAFFFYPWMRGATLYSLRFPKEHPIQTAAYAQLGAQGHKRAEEAFGPFAGYAPGTEGLVPIGRNRGSNLTNLSTFSTPVEAGQALADPSRLPQQLGPAAGALYTLVSGKTPIGAEVPATENRYKAAGEQLLNLVPLQQALQRAKQHPADKVIKEPIFPKGPQAAIERYIGGSVFPQPINKPALEAKGEKAFREKLDAEQKARYDAAKTLQQARQDAATLHHGVLPASVRQALDLDRRRKLGYAQAAKKQGVSVTNLPVAAKADVVARIVSDSASPEVVATFRRLVAQAPDPQAASTIISRFWRIYGHGEALSAWRHYVTTNKRQR